MRKKALLMSILFGYLAIMMEASAQPAPTYTESAINVDGQLNEAQWQSAPVIEDFGVIRPETFANPKHPTKARVLYGEQGLYFAISNYQPANTQVERLSARDNNVERDSVQLVLDTSGNGLYGYVFTVGLGGSLMDGTVQPERKFAYEWNAPWQAKTSRHDDRWDAEVFIPWSALKLPSATDKRTIGLSIERRISYLAENWAAPALARSSNVFLSALLPLEFNVVEAESELVFVPYFSSTFDQLNNTNDQNFGFDLYYQPSSDSQLSVTIMPDFGQVENDEIVVNFSAFETFTPEKRAFFLEGQEIFKPKGERMVNTRRIGARPDVPQLSEGQEVETSVGFSDVLAAGKYTGQTGNMRYGVMSAFEDDSAYTLTDGTEGTVDGRNYLVLRNVWETQDDDGQFQSIGYLGALTDHHYGLHQSHLIDGEFRTADQQWQFDGQFYMSDAWDEQGYGQRVRAEYSPEAGVKHLFTIKHYDRQLRLNDLGYLRRNDLLNFHYGLHTPEVTDTEDYKSRDQGLWFDHRKNLDGKTLQTRLGIWGVWTLNNLSQFNLTFNYTDSAWNDRKTRGYGAYRTNRYANLWSRWRSDRSLPFSYGIAGWMRHAQLAGTIASIRPFIKYSPTDRINIDADIRYKMEDNWQIWGGDEDRINTFDAQQLDMTVKTTWIIDDSQELRIAMQWVGLTAEARDRYRIGLDGSLEQSEVDELQESFAQADLALQVRYKYEFAPLSDLYLVYSRGGNAFESTYEDAQGFDGLFSDSLDGTIADQLTLKVRYRF